VKRALVELIVVVLIIGVLSAIVVHDVSVMVHAYHAVNK
jgi:hypothetical protein